MNRRILYYGNYYIDFYSKQDDKTKRKIDFVLDLIRKVDWVPIKFLKYLEGTDELYEIRVATISKSVRILCFFDEGKLVILLNCFVKKTNKTPKEEIERGMKLKKEYFADKMRWNRK